MSPLTHLVMFGWIPAVLLLFAVFPPRTAVIAAFVGAWMFLPVARYEFSGLPEYTKMSATCLGILLGATLFDADRLFNIKLTGWDLPMGMWLVSPTISSLSNGLGMYDGVSAFLNQFTTWGLPYLVGRVYLATPRDLEVLVKAFFLGGIAYIPLCLFEIRMSPQLHRMFYGFYPHPDFAQTIRMGGYRPMVFMEHGLMVGMWMSGSTLCGVWLWMTKAVTDIRGIAMKYLVPALFVTLVLCKSMGALGLMIIGLVLMYFCRRFKTSIFILMFLMLPPTYMVCRSTGLWSGDAIGDMVASVSEERAGSLIFRFENEDILLDKAVQRPVFGWGGWGRARVYNEEGEDISTTDGLWIIVLGNYGVWGLTAMLGLFLIPTVRTFRLWGKQMWIDRHATATLIMGVLLILYTVDNILNAMINPIFIFAAGAMAAQAAHGEMLPHIWETEGVEEQEQTGDEMQSLEPAPQGTRII